MGSTELIFSGPSEQLCKTHLRTILEAEGAGGLYTLTLLPTTVEGYPQVVAAPC